MTLPREPDPDQPVTFAPPRSGGWLDLILQYRYALIVVLVLLFVLVQQAVAQEFKSCKISLAAGTTPSGTGDLP